ncbi:MAG: DUF5666 domain-containing protein [Terriglobales bacterium]|jgi:hypothetical protein
MSRIYLSVIGAVLVYGTGFAQQPSGTSAAPAPGTHMDQSTVQSIGSTRNGAGASVTNPRPSPDAGTALPTMNTGNSLVSGTPLPVTKTIGGGGLADPSDVADLLAPKPLTQSKLSLVGGTVKSIDQIRDRMTVNVYGSNGLHVTFDQRTHFFRDGKETTQLAVKPGDRVYLDTQLFAGKIFAKNVHVQTSNGPADASGQIASFDSKSGNMVLFDQLAGSSVKFRVGPQTRIKSGDSAAGQSSLRPGALIAVKFSPRSRNAGSADEISIIAEPGTAFTYFGRVTHLDIRSGSLSIENRADGKTYDVHFDPSTRVPDNLLVGSQVTVVATFEGDRYTTQSIEVNAGPDQALAGGAESMPSARDAESNDGRGGKHAKNKSESKSEKTNEKKKDQGKDSDDDDQL